MNMNKSDNRADWDWSSSRLIDKEDIILSAYYYYVLPVIAFIATSQNLICVITLAQKELRNSSAFFKYSLVNSIISTITTLLSGFLFLIKCGSLCSTSQTYAGIVYEKYVSYLLIPFTLMFSSLLHLAISFDLYFVLIQKSSIFTRASPYKVSFCVFIMCQFYTIVFSLGYEVSYQLTNTTSTNNQTVSIVYYFISLRNQNQIFAFCRTFLLSIVNFGSMIMLLVLNILVLKEIRKLIDFKTHTAYRISNHNSNHSQHNSNENSGFNNGNNNGQVGNNDFSVVANASTSVENHTKSHEKKAQKKIFILFIWISLMFASTRLLFMAQNLIKYLIPPNSLVFDYVFIFYNSWGYLVYSSYFMLYMKTNRLFKVHFYRIFLRRRTNQSQ